MSSSDLARFWAKVSPEPNSGCWLWDAGVSDRGYGRFRVGNRTLRAHRFSWEIHNGALSNELELDHRVCRLKCCVNPDHLVPCTPQEHKLQPDTPPLFQKHVACAVGHPYLPETVYYDPHGTPRCKVCRKEYRAKHEAKKRQQRTTGNKLTIAQKEAMAWLPENGEWRGGQTFHMGLALRSLRHALPDFIERRLKGKYNTISWRLTEMGMLAKKMGNGQ